MARGIRANKRASAVRPDGRIGLKLIRMVTDWAKSQEAIEMHIHSTSGIDPERTDKLLSRLGFKTYGGNYAVGLG